MLLADTICDLELPLAEASHPRLQRLHRYWLEKAAGRAMPRRVDIDPLDLGFAMGWISLVRVESDGRFRIVIDGSHVRTLIGQPLHGRLVDQLLPQPLGQLVNRQLTDVVRDRRPILHEILLDTAQAIGRYRRLSLPLSADGSTVDAILAVYWWLSDRAG